MNATVTTALAAALLVVGGAFDSPSLYVPGVALLTLVGGVMAWVQLASRGVRLERVPGPKAVTEGEPYPLRIEQRGGLLPPWGELVDPLLERPLPISAGRGSTRPRAERTLCEDVRFERRGRHRLEPPRLIVRDPLGICSRQVEGQSTDEIVVLPRVEPVHAASDATRDGDEVVSGAGESSGSDLGGLLDVELDGLRPYRKGSPASRIHWPAVARHGELIERRLASGGEGTALVILDAQRPAGPDALDRAVRAAASLCVHLARAGGCTLLVAGAPRPLRIDPKLRGWPQAHVRLALAEPGDSLTGVARSTGGGTMFWVTAEDGGGPRRGAGGPSGFLVTPFPAAGGSAVFTVAGCHGWPLSGPRRAARVAA
jgi:uncharacterized protein (DUF58 family)